MKRGTEPQLRPVSQYYPVRVRIMNSASTHKNPDFWIFGLFFFLYFFIMATCFPFLPVWLSDVVGLSKTDTGIVFSCLSLFAISFQPLLGVISDRLD